MSTPEQKERRAAYMRKWNKSAAGIAYYESRKQAHAKYVKKWNRANLEKRRAQNRASHARHLETRKRYRKLYGSTYPEREAAHQAIRYAVQYGKLIRPSRCSNCNAECKAEAHHHLGYALEHHLDVVWLCTFCHREADKLTHPRS